MWRRIKRNWFSYVSKEGLFVMAREYVSEEDLIAVIEEAKVPLILRFGSQQGGHDHYEIVSPAYVHGYMDGEARNQDREGRLLKRGTPYRLDKSHLIHLDTRTDGHCRRKPMWHLQQSTTLDIILLSQLPVTKVIPE